jgi:hypothetical protein
MILKKLYISCMMIHICKQLTTEKTLFESSVSQRKRFNLAYKPWRQRKAKSIARKIDVPKPKGNRNETYNRNNLE